MIGPSNGRSPRAATVRLFTAAGLFLASLLALSVPRQTAAEELKQVGTVQIEQVQIAWIGSGNLGGGTLQFGGKSYSFTIGGLGIGGFGISRMTATGEVYNMSSVAQFAGAYGQARYGVVVGNLSKGELWLQNPSGVVMHLLAKRQGLALSLGADAIYVQFD
jgi:hypothetical protein